MGFRAQGYRGGIGPGAEGAVPVCIICVCKSATHARQVCVGGYFFRVLCSESEEALGADGCIIYEVGGRLEEVRPM